MKHSSLRCSKWGSTRSHRADRSQNKRQALLLLISLLGVIANAMRKRRRPPIRTGIRDSGPSRARSLLQVALEMRTRRRKIKKYTMIRLLSLSATSRSRVFWLWEESLARRRSFCSRFTVSYAIKRALSRAPPSPGAPCVLFLLSLSLSLSLYIYIYIYIYSSLL